MGQPIGKEESKNRSTGLEETDIVRKESEEAISRVL
jgi:hypothetical protein